ncbi:MAG TPA: hypothetical protein VD866_14185 [Urbifossiella sp.]|nr:hypothetical protein [Urbifossiella sp.]
MRCFLLVTVVAAATASSVAAQPRGGRSAAGPQLRGGFGAPPGGGGFRMVQAPPLPRTSGFGLGVGLGTTYGVGGGYPSGYGYGAGGFIAGGYGPSPYYVVPPPALPAGGIAPAPSAPAAPAVPSGATALSGVLPATLVIEYPAAAKVWLNGVEVPGDAGATWTFTSRDLRPGEAAMFRVRGRWAAGGKTFESEREVPLGPGARSRLLVVSGTEVRE